MDNNFKKAFIAVIVISIIVSSIVGAGFGFWAGSLASNQLNFGQWFGFSKPSAEREKIIKVSEDSAVISAVDKVSPAVVSIIITKNLPKIQQYGNPFGSEFFRQFFGSDFPDFALPSQPQNNNQSNQDSSGTVKQEIGGGSGFIITADGLIVTNRHVVDDAEADYTVLMNDGKKFPAKVVGQDQTIDLAILKIDAKNLPTVELGDSANLKVGQSVIAIGNALGEFRNTVSTGVISGLARSITASGALSGAEELENVIQTDASINQGNSGGPLLNIAGQVIGINTAMAQGAQNIGFAIPIDAVKSIINNVKTNGRIVRPWLGVRYLIINQSIAQDNKLSVDYGAIIVRGQKPTDLAVIPGSPADKAGLTENDIILEINGEKITEENLLAAEIAKFKPGQEITLKVLHQAKEKTIKVKLEEAR
ncbi:MAG: trypsin-like peptidase domain-containing protein [Patescibacteria group bacterium]|nr:trypsin-like peptidase domain-containing protein [Patescibacteria group bacterium]